jgi:hypothetical protein
MFSYILLFSNVGLILWNYVVRMLTGPSGVQMYAVAGFVLTVLNFGVQSLKA